MGYIRQLKKIETNAVVGAVCDNCGKELEHVFPCYPEDLLYKGMLTVTLEGGFAAYFDGPDAEVLFCKDCANKLVEQFPCIGRVIESA
jgi:hypothetical protein